MTPARRIRVAAAAVCVAGIAGMIASSIAANTGAALAFGLATVAAVLCSMVATAVGWGGAVPDDEDQAARVERLVGDLLAAGADEPTVRQLVRDAVRLGRIRSGRPEA